MPKVKFMIGAKSGSSESLNSLVQPNSANNHENNASNEENRSPSSPDALKSDLMRFVLFFFITL